MSDSDRLVLDAFIDNIWIEKGLSKNTLESYRSDLEQFSNLGSGFSIAMRDLDIRGAGDLLGADQSGFINEIGF